MASILDISWENQVSQTDQRTDGRIITLLLMTQGVTIEKRGNMKCTTIGESY